MIEDNFLCVPQLCGGYRGWSHLGVILESFWSQLTPIKILNDEDEFQNSKYFSELPLNVPELIGPTKLRTKCSF